MGGSASARLLKLFEGHRLTPTQRRIAHCLVRHAAEAPFLSSVELAGLAGVSQPSVTRFAVALGFDGYPALRRSLRETVPGDTAPETGTEAPESGADRADRPDAPDRPHRFDHSDRSDRSDRSTEAARPNSPPLADGSSADEGRVRPAGEGADAPANAYQQAVRAEIDNLRHLSALLADPEPLERAGRLLAGSSPLPVLGLRAAAAQARDFAYFAAKVHPDVRLLDEGGSMLTDRTDAVVNAGASALLCFALPRHPRETVTALDHARRAGLRIVTVADSAFAPVGHPDDLVLPGAVGTELVFDTAAAPMLLGRALLEAMCDCLPDAQSRLERFDARAAERGLFIE